MRGLVIEGVTYRPFRVRYVEPSGRRRSLTLWSPGLPWLREEVARALDERDVKLGSNVRIEAAS